MNELKEWIKIYLNHRDMMYGRIKEFKDIASDILQVHYIDGSKDFYIEPDLSKLNFTNNFAIVFFNTKSNINDMIKYWNKIKKNPRISIYFVNTKHNQKWIINPYTHSKVSDVSNLKKSIMVLTESVPFM